jgi:hypothetical protein
MGEAHGTHGRDEKCTYKFWSVNRKGRYLKDEINELENNNKTIFQMCKEA